MGKVKVKFGSCVWRVECEAFSRMECNASKVEVCEMKKSLGDGLFFDHLKV